MCILIWDGCDYNTEYRGFWERDVCLFISWNVGSIDEHIVNHGSQMGQFRWKLSGGL